MRATGARETAASSAVVIEIEERANLLRDVVTFIVHNSGSQRPSIDRTPRFRPRDRRRVCLAKA